MSSIYLPRLGGSMSGSLTVESTVSCPTLRIPINEITLTTDSSGNTFFDVPTNGVSGSGLRVRTRDPDGAQAVYRVYRSYFDCARKTILNCPTINNTPSAFCRLVPYSEGGVNYYTPTEYSGMYWLQTPLGVPVAQRMANGMFCLNVDCGKTTFSSSNHVESVCVSARGRAGIDTDMSKQLIINEYLRDTSSYTVNSLIIPKTIGIIRFYFTIQRCQLTTVADETDPNTWLQFGFTGIDPATVLPTRS